MKAKLLLLFVLANALCFGQGLNAEHGFNSTYDQRTSAVVCVNEYTYLATFETMPNSFFSMSSVYKLDTLENIIWKQTVAPAFGEYTPVYEMIPSETGGVYVSGYLRLYCDVSRDCEYFIQKYDADGEVLWTKMWRDEFCSGTRSSGLSLNSANEIVVNYTSETGAYIYTFDQDGNVINNIPTSLSGLGGFENVTGHGKITFKENLLYGIDNTGALTELEDFHFDIQDMRFRNDTLYVLTIDSIYTFDANIQPLDANKTPGYTHDSKLKISTNTVSFIVNSTTAQHVITYNKELQLVNEMIIPVPPTAKKDFNSTHFALGNDFPITEYKAIRYRDFSLHSAENAHVNTTDITVIDLRPTQVNTIPYQPASNIYTTEIYAEVLIKNVGTNVLHDCLINHHMGPSISCGELYFMKQLSNLDLAPGESVWVDLGKMHSSTGHRSPEITEMDICVYSSHPNFKTDLNVPNDKLCKPLYIGSLGLTEQAWDKVSLSPNPTNGILKIQSPMEDIQAYLVCNLQGQTVHKGKLISGEIDLTVLAGGLYVMHFISADGITGAGNRVVKE